MTTTIEIDVRMDCPAWIEALPDAEARCGRLAATALEAVELPDGVVELSIVLADDAIVQDLNRNWRGKNQPTNVLSFAALDDEDAPLVPGAPLMLGDVILAYETTAAEAKEQGKPFADHFSHLVVHGVLHLLGFDHEDEDEAVEMEALESTLMAALGIPDPYGEEDEGP
ncbi:rRNA maturation RNase YbeY [Paramagnetospirillum kuznetsovii]|uniref:Endoribonuclease YbeY n=1 Tax=Paramagnetospirillum kuznetsovii TaxID=2053833 RepID=A0A364P3G9_9PROT|nr:rRNA maturation RNase YbeY [Paramagnetospirillum kuznetsovii]RAU23841.1 rRNA maturation RNase YbeY [Paramagnetospirillum kuznetsovii]